ncbi:hypothetical protein [Legionella gresilensis]|uniref:hypothetical protein n=1 Tax=Legionella gresilensis TaxID=91823 RepID=UPI001041398C|nr:hypothetical protein [Legionella gresilensis]
MCPINQSNLATLNDSELQTILPLPEILISHSSNFNVDAKGVWVYEKTGIAYPNLEDIPNLKNTEIQHGLVVKGQLEVYGHSIKLEYITQDALLIRQRQVWVIKGTSQVYQGEITNYTSSTNKKGTFSQTGEGKDEQGNVLTLECINPKTLRARQQQVWVIKGTSQVYQGEITNYTSSTNKKGTFSQTGEGKDEQGNVLTLECITQNALRQRQKKDKQLKGKAFSAMNETTSTAFPEVELPVKFSQVEEALDGNIDLSEEWVNSILATSVCTQEQAENEERDVDLLDFNDEILTLLSTQPPILSSADADKFSSKRKSSELASEIQQESPATAFANKRLKSSDSLTTFGFFGARNSVDSQDETHQKDSADSLTNK